MKSPYAYLLTNICGIFTGVSRSRPTFAHNFTHFTDKLDPALRTADVAATFEKSRAHRRGSFAGGNPDGAKSAQHRSKGTNNTHFMFLKG